MRVAMGGDRVGNGVEVRVGEGVEVRVGDGVGLRVEPRGRSCALR
jgi:hypothetical protein